MDGMAFLAFDQAPPFRAPNRFFLTAPVFMILAGCLLALRGPEIFLSRWMPASLAATHLITVGFLLMTMLGALIQILPVVAGAHIRQPVRIAVLVHGGLTAGTLALAVGFLAGDWGWYLAASLLLGFAILVFVGAALQALWPVPTTSPTLRGIKLALPGLAGVATLGVLMALSLAFGWELPLIDLTAVHAAWGFAAWIAVLVMAISYVVVPMFQLTPGYAARPSWWWPPALVLAVWGYTGAVLLDAGLLSRVLEALLVLLAGGFAAYTLNLQRQRRRARVDTPTLYWHWGLLIILAALAMALAAAMSPELTEWSGWSALFGCLLLGGIVALVIGMLYRIVPFLVWLHLQERGKAPSVGKLLPDSRMRWQMRVYFLALALVCGAVFFPAWLSIPAGLALAASGLWLLVNLAGVARVLRAGATE